MNFDDGDRMDNSVGWYEWSGLDGERSSYISWSGPSPLSCSLLPDPANGGDGAASPYPSLLRRPPEADQRAPARACECALDLGLLLDCQSIRVGRGDPAPLVRMPGSSEPEPLVASSRRGDRRWLLGTFPSLRMYIPPDRGAGHGAPRRPRRITPSSFQLPSLSPLPRWPYSNAPTIDSR